MHSEFEDRPSSPVGTVTAWLSAIVRPRTDAEFFDRLAERVASSAPEPCASCA